MPTSSSNSTYKLLNHILKEKRDTISAAILFILYTTNVYARNAFTMSSIT